MGVRDDPERERERGHATASAYDMMSTPVPGLTWHHPQCNAGAPRTHSYLLAGYINTQTVAMPISDKEEELWRHGAAHDYIL